MCFVSPKTAHFATYPEMDLSAHSTKVLVPANSGLFGEVFGLNINTNVRMNNKKCVRSKIGRRLKFRA